MFTMLYNMYMSSPMEQEPSTEGVPELVKEVLDSSAHILTIAFDNVFNSSGSTSYAEWVQFDRATLPGMTLFSVLLSESGGKGDRGVDMLRIMAFPTEHEYANSIELAATVSHLGDELPFSSGRFIYERTYAEEDVVPNLFSIGEEDGVVRMLRGGELDRKVAEADTLDFDTLLQAGTEGLGEGTPDIVIPADEGSPGTLSPEDWLLLLDTSYITEDYANWPIIPQN